MQQRGADGSRGRSPIAVVGMSCLFPKAQSLADYWSNIRRGADAVGEVPSSHWRLDDYYDPDPKRPDRTYARRGGFLDPIDYDPARFGIAPANLSATDASQLLSLVVAQAAMIDAGYGPEREFDRKRVSVVAGVTGTLQLAVAMGGRLGHPIWRRALDKAGVEPEIAEEVVKNIGDSFVVWQENTFPGLLGNVVAGRIANRLDLGGANCVVDAACASSVSAAHLASLELETGRSDMVITGGADTFNDIFMYMCFSKTPALSPTGDARPFSSDADGTILGEGIGMVVLKRLEDAERDGDKIYAVIRGIGRSSDGRGKAIYAPSAEGQERCLRDAYAQAGVSPDSIDLVEAHGTGTKVGDAVEISALTKVYREARAEGVWCALGSVKSQIGHTKAAAGVASLIKAALALRYKVLPPTIKVKEPAAALKDSPFYANVEKRPWLTRPGRPRRAALSSFGFGGSNFHMVLEEHRPEKAEIDWDGRVQILALSDATLDGLKASARRWAAPIEWPAFRREAAASRKAFSIHHAYRLVLVVEREKTDLPAVMTRLLARLEAEGEAKRWATPEGAYFGRGAAHGKLAFLFPGQGSQYVGMCRDLVCLFPKFQEVLTEANLAYDDVADLACQLSDFIFPHQTFTEESRKLNELALRATHVAQPAIGAVSLGIICVLSTFGVHPAMAAGHSFGELVALLAGGRITPEDFHRLAKLRGALMAEGEGDRGTMLAVQADEAATLAALGDDSGVVVANRNAPRQIVLSGPTEEIAGAEAKLKAAGISCKGIPVAAAFHSDLVAGASRPFRDALDAVEFADGTIEVYANTTGEPYPADGDAARDLLGAQLAKPVEFVREIENMYAAGARTFVEAGPGGRMTGLVNAILGDRDAEAFATDASGGRGDGVVDLARTLARLAALGHEVDLAAWESDAAEPIDLARGDGKTTFKLTGANYGNPYLAETATRSGAEKQQGKNRGATETRRSPKPDAATPAPAVSSSVRPAAPAPPTPSIQPTPSIRSIQSIQSIPSIPSIQSIQSIPSIPPRPTTPPDTVLPMTDSPTPAPADPAAWAAYRASQDNLAALQRMQEQTARAHAAFLDGQNAALNSLGGLIAHQQAMFERMLAGGSPGGATSFAPSNFDSAPPPAIRPAHVAPPAPALASASAGFPAPPAAAPSPAYAPAAPPPRQVAPTPPAPAPPLALPSSAVPRSASSPAAGFPASPASPSASSATSAAILRTLLFEVVSEKTGYPAETIDGGMDLEADLGIDSIKRVEILSALQDRSPDLPEVSPDELGSLRTLDAILARLAPAAHGPDARNGHDSSSSASSTAAPPLSANSATSAAILRTLLFAVVSEKTGYPAETIDGGMDLEADLGIDSIKRVEILAALQDRAPDLPEVSPDELGSLRTLDAILARLAPVSHGLHGPDGRNGLDPSAAPDAAPAASVASVAPVAPPRSAIALRRVEVVAERDDAPGARIALPEGTILVATSNDAAEGAFARALASALAEESGRSVELVAAADLASAPAHPALASPLAGLILVREATPAEPAAGGWSEASEARLAEAFRAARAAAPALRASRTSPALFATATRIDGRFGLDGVPAALDPSAGALAGLAKTVAREWPEVRSRALDAAADWEDAAAARSVARELLREEPTEIGLAPEGRFRVVERESSDPRSSAAPPPSAEIRLAPNDVVVVSGGARGVAAECAIALAEATGATLALLGRSPAPSPEPEWLDGAETEAEIKRAIVAHGNGASRTPATIEAEFRRIAANREVAATLDRIRATGARAVYVSADARDGAAIARALDSLRREVGPIRGLVFGAGVLADRLIEEKTDAQFDAVFSTKVAGLRALLEATAGDDLALVALFSSVSARYGRRGQVDYAMANELLNKAAQRLRRARPATRVVSIGWGPWDGGMVKGGLRKVFESEGIGLIPLREGAEFFAREVLSAPGGPAEILASAGAPEAERAAPDDAPAIAANGNANGDARRAAEPSARGRSRRSGADAPALAFERRLAIETHPFLRSHVLGGRAVLPAAIAMEWLSHAALHANPGLRFVGLDDFRVLRGVKLDEGESIDLAFLAARPDFHAAGARVEVEMRDADGSPLARARAILSDAAPQAEPVALPTRPRIDSSLDDAALYRDYLFHGERFLALTDVLFSGDELALAATFPAPRPEEWMDSPPRTEWISDPLAIDAAFQLAIVWSRARHGVPSLPTGFASYRRFAKRFPDVGTSLAMRGVRTSPHAARADFEWVARDGSLVARMTGYECVLDPSLGEAFARNALAGVAVS